MTATARAPIPLRRRPDDIEELTINWDITLEGEGKTARTRATYLAAITDLTAYLTENGLPRRAHDIDRTHLRAYMSHLFSRPKPVRPATASIRYRSLQQFWKFLVKEEGLPANPFATMTPPIVPEEPPPILSDEQLHALLAACQGRDFAAVRDMAIIRLLIDTGIRRGELAGMTVDSLDMEYREIKVTGKGRRERRVPFASKTALALRRYLVLREERLQHRDRDTAQLWLGHSRKPLTGNGLYQIVRDRARIAGLVLYPHMLRHLFAHAWLAADGQEQDLMRLAGWRSRAMVARYGSSAAAERARDAHRRLNLGNRI